MIWDSYLKGWKNIFNFTGRTTRMEYWMFTILNFLFLAVLLIAIIVPAGLAFDDPHEIFGKIGILIIFLVIPYIFAAFSQLVRRIRDTGISGWWTLLFLPVNAILYGIPSIILGFIPSSTNSLTSHNEQSGTSNTREEAELKRYEYNEPKANPSSGYSTEKKEPTKPLKRLE